jgi:hypothetical protein
MSGWGPSLNGSSFSGLLTRVDIGRIRIGAAVAWTLSTVRVAWRRDKWRGRK